jgi:hypothetical protein
MRTARYTELLVQFGYVTIFAAAFPAAAVFALVNNLVELRSDAAKILLASQRPYPWNTSSIGIFQTMLEVMSFIAVTVNCLIIGFVSGVLGSRWKYGDLSEDEHPELRWRRLLYSLIAVVIAEHVLLCLKLVIAAAVPDTPLWVMQCTARTKFEGEIAALRNKTATQSLHGVNLNVDVDQFEEDRLVQQQSAFI